MYEVIKMKKVTVTLKAEINELDLEKFNEEIPEYDIKATLREIKYYIENDIEIRNRFWKYIIDFAIKESV
jgi:hypothetical protein